MGIDVTVMGAGIFGLSCAWAMVRRGARVRVIDPAGPGAGASGGLLGALAPHAPENWTPVKAFQLESLLAAEAFWAEVATAGGLTPGYARAGRVQPIPDDRALALARTRAEAARDLWQGRAVWEIRPADPAWGPVSATGLVIHDTLSARIAPRRAIAALVAALRAQGAEVTAEGAGAGRILWATGHAGLADLSAALGREVGGPQKGQAALLAHGTPGDAPQVFAGGLHIVPHADGTVAVGSTSERGWRDPRSTDEALDALIARARAAVPALGTAKVLERWAGLRPRAATRAPLLGPWPGRPGHYVANGGFKIGFGMAPGVAHTVADLMLEDRNTIPEAFVLPA